MVATGRRAALVLAGAVVKGAFEAGALEVIASRGVSVRRIVAASSGALNGTAFAAGVRARRELDVARDLVEVWENDASLCGILRPSLRAIATGRGISDSRKLLALLRRHVRPSSVRDPAPVELRIVLAALRGHRGRLDGEAATAYSKMLTFPGASFDAPEALESVFVAATASAAFPLLFAPVEVPGVGPCTDGGIVNPAPTLAALCADPADAVDAILVVLPTPPMITEPREEYRGFRLLAHALSMVFAEWLYQDLRRATHLQEGLARLDALAARNLWTSGQLHEIKAALDLQRVAAVPIVAIRPQENLPGTIFTGFTDGEARRSYVRMGRERATQVLDEIGWG
jgi:NTE family protein